jgi:hypothetical protein
MPKLKILLIILFVFTIQSLKAETGVGCVIEMGNGGVIYTTDLGFTNFYGNKYRVYSRTGNTYLKKYDPTSNCGETNSANITSYTQPSYSNQCWVSNYLNPTNDQTTAAYGAWVTYTSVTPCPIDDYAWLMILVIAFLGGLFITQKVHVN